MQRSEHVCEMNSVLSTISLFFFFNDTATTEIYTLSLHDALPIFPRPRRPCLSHSRADRLLVDVSRWRAARSEEHTSELQSQSNLVCRLLLEKKKKKISVLRKIFTLDANACIV